MEVVVTDTIPLREMPFSAGQITTRSVAKISGEAIRRIHSADSLSTLSSDAFAASGIVR